MFPVLGSFIPRKPFPPTNGSFENYPTFVAATTTANRYIDGTAAGSTTNQSFGSWAIPAVSVTAAASAQFDTTESYSGGVSMKLSTLDATGAITVGNARTATAPTATEVFTLLPSTAYVITARVKTVNVAANGAFIDVRQFTSAFSAITTTSSNKLAGTNDWTLVTINVTTASNCACGIILLRLNVAGNVSSANFDHIIVRRA